MKDYPVIPITASLIFGIILASSITIDNDVIIIFVAVAAVLVILSFLITPPKFRYLSIVSNLSIIGMIVGATLFINEPKIQSLKIHKEKNAYAIGEIRSIDLIKERELSFKIDCDTLRFNDSTSVTDLKINVRILEQNKIKIDSLYNRLKPGYKVSLVGTFTSGKEKRNPGEFDYGEYLIRNKVSGVISVFSVDKVFVIDINKNVFRSFVFELRKALDESLSQFYSRETAGLLRGFLLADRNEISADIKNDFTNSGVVHILAVSGSNVGYIVIIFLILFQRFNIRFRLLITILGIIFFFLITDFPTSVFRASLMSVVIILTNLTGRNTNIFNSLALSALIILLIDSSQLFDPGFQLSFSAVLSIAVFVPILNDISKSERIRNSFLKSIIIITIVSLAAQIGTLPLTLYYFGKYSIVGIVANIFIIPLSALIIAVGIFTLFLSFISTYITLLSAETNNLLSQLLFDSIHFAGNLDYSYVNVPGFSLIDIFIFYTFTVIVLYTYRKFNHFYSKFILIILTVLNIFVFTSLDNKGFFFNNQLNILMIDVGQGDAVLIKFPNGETALIDAGDATGYFDSGEKIILPLLNHLEIHTIDYGFISHLDSDHYGGFVSLIHHQKIKRIIKPKTDTSSVKDHRFEAYLEKNRVPYEFYKEKGQLIGNAKLYCLTGDFISGTRLSHNNKSGVLKLVYGDSEILFTGDIEKQAELLYSSNFGNFLQVDILKVAHHGSKTSTTEGFLSKVNPGISLISAGVQNKFRHPSLEIINRLKQYNSKILRTDEFGAIFLTSNGYNFSVINWK